MRRISQASIVFDVAKRMVEPSPALLKVDCMLIENCESFKQWNLSSIIADVGTKHGLKYRINI